MKKITLLILFLFSLAGYSQALIEDFEGTTLPDTSADIWVLDSGTWGVFDNGVGLGQSWTVNTAVTTPIPTVYEGDRSAYMNRENIGIGNTSRDYLATPAVSVPANGQLRFFTRSTINSDQGTLYKIMVAPASSAQNDAGAYTLIQQWNEDQLTQTFNIYEEKVVDLTAFAGQSVYIAFVMEYNQVVTGLNGDRWLVDLVRVVEECSAPTNLQANLVTQTSAQLSWTPNGPATEWEVEIIPATGTATGVGTVVTNPFTATTTLPAGVPFTPTTAYTYYVRSVCSGDGTTEWTSEWAGPITFTTSSPGLTCNSPIVIAPGVPYSTTDNTGNYQDPIDTPQPASCVGTPTNYMSGNDVFYSYTATENGAISIDMTVTDDGAGIFVYEGCTNVGTVCVAGDINTGTLPLSIPSLSVTAGQQYIIVISSSNVSATVGYTLTVQTLNCAAPTNLSAVGTGENAGVYTAELSWDNPGAASSFEIFVQTAGSGIPTTSGETTTDNEDFEIDSLTSGTPLGLGQYQYWVRSDCGDGTFSPWAGPYIFNTTTCDTGCNYQFVMVDSFGDGWNGNTMNVVQNGVTVQVLTGPTNADDSNPITVNVPLCNGPFTLFWNSGGTWAGEVGVTIINSFGQVLFTHTPGTAAQNTTLYSGVVDCDNPSCLPPSNLTVSNITPVGATLSWTPNGPLPVSWDIFAVSTGSPAPTAASVPNANTTTFPYTLTGLQADTAYTYYVRAVCAGPGANPWSAPSPSFTTLPTCPKPTALTVTNIGQTTATFGWTPGLSETAWQVIALPDGSPAPTAATAGWTAAPTNPFTLGGLVAGTAYDFYVRAVCSATDSSTWSGPLSFNTSICEVVDQCIYSFVMIDSWGDGWNGNTMNIVQNGVTVATIGSTFTGGLGPVTVQVPLCNGLPFTLFWNSGGGFANEVGISIVNSFNQVIYVKAPGTGTQNSTLFTGNVDCVNPLCLPPTNLQVSNITTFGATLAWTPNGPAPLSWDVYAVPTGSPAPTAATPPTANTTNNPFTIGGLLADTTYTYYVRAVCSGPGANAWSAPSAPFTTLPTCPKPTGLSVSGITQTSAIFQWTAGSTETAWQVIALPAGSPAPTAATAGWVPAPTNPFTLGGLNLGTSYDFYIMAICTPDDSSTPAGPLNFNTTICDPVDQCLYSFVMVDSFGDSWNGNTMTVLQNGIPVATLTGPTNADDTNPITQTVALCNGIPFSLVWNAGGAFANEVGISIIGFLGDNLYTHAPGTSQQGQTLYSETAMCVPPTCPQPIDLTLIGTSTEAAILGWTEAGSATQWAVVVQPAGSGIPSAGEGVIVNGTPEYTTPGVLAPGFYEFYVQAICADDDISFWSGPMEFFISAQSVVCASVDIQIETNTPGVIELCPGESCLDLSATFTDSYDTTDYVVNPIPFAPPFPFIGGTEVSVNTDDIWSPVVTLPFNFCFYGTNYTSIQVGSNGVLTFNPEAAPGYCPWPFTQTIPNTTFPIRNAIYGVYQDINPATSTAPLIHNINYQLLGTAPCRTFVVNYYQVAQFSCGTSVGLQTSQIVLYETSNIIDVYVQDRTSCTTWNSGNGVIGIQNAAGTVAHVPPGRNTGTWEAHDEAWRFTPDGESNVEFAWLMDGEFYSNDTTINVCVSENTMLTAQATYTGCGGTQTVTTEDVLLQINEVDVLPIDDVSVCDSYILPELALGNYFTEPGGLGTPLNAGDVISETQTIYVYATQGVTNVCSDEESFTVNVGNLDVSSPGDQTVCDSYTLPELTVGAYFTEAGGLGTPMFPGQAITETQTIHVYGVSGVCIGEESFVVTVNQTPDVLPVAPVSGCSEFTLPPLTVGNYFTEANGGGTPLNEGDVLTETQTIYVYASDGTCTDEESFVVTIGTQTVTVPADITVCDSYPLPALALGNYYTLPGGNGTLLNVDDLITSTQTIYVYWDGGECTDEGSFVVTVNYTPVIPPVSNVTACQCYTLPVLAVGNYYTGPNATGTPLNAGDQICTDQTVVYIYAETNTNPNCFAETSFTVTIGDFTVVAPADITVCDSYALPALALGSYYTGQGGTGMQLNVGDPITSTQTIYVYLNDGVCVDEASFTVTVNYTPVIPPVSNVTACTCYTLPALTVGNYFTAPGGTGTQLNAGDQICTDQTTVYIYAQTGTNPNCFSETSFVVTIGTLSVTAPADVEVCDSYTLPALAQGNYFSGQNGTGTPYFAGNVINTGMTLYVYLNDGVCTAEDNMVITINQTPVITVSNVTACNTYTLPALSVGNYFTAPGGGGVQMNAGDVISVDQTVVYVYAQSGTGTICPAEASFTVTLVTTPDVADVADVVSCDSYTLLPIVGPGSYFTGPDGTGTPLNAGDVLTLSQTVYIYSSAGTAPDNCTDQESFDVTIGTTPQYQIFGGCQGTKYILEAVVTDSSFDPDTATYLWSAGTGGTIIGSNNTQSVEVSGIGTYTLVVSSGGCTSVGEAFTTVNTTCTIQKGISANGDGDNDYFDLEGQDVAELQIFNRYGVSVYSRKGYSNQWYGQSDKGEELPDGTYYFVINRNSGETKTGWIYINREQ